MTNLSLLSLDASCESSTDREMRNIASTVFAPVSEDNEVASQVSSPVSQVLVSFDGMSFDPAIASTQKTILQEIPPSSNQPMAPEDKKATSLSVSLHPTFVAVNEVNQTRHGSGDGREAERNVGIDPLCSPRRDDSSSSSVVEIFQDDIQMSQESDSDSVVALDSVSQDLEKFFCAVEEAQSTTKHFGFNLEEVDFVQPGERFKLTVRINELLPKQTSDDIAGLKSLLVAFCEECSHLWQYNHFINSVASERVVHPRNSESTGSEEKESDFGAINYLCSEEDHYRMCPFTCSFSLTRWPLISLTSLIIYFIRLTSPLFY